ncbi:unnamed protein product [Adineta steineri]|uniref:NAD(P)(+)--arginine ADP-ribosyltransferase n=1 Tax=Adineta steineri TaxID=433720 RepID=A0A818XTB2_9BILA|nr:unnamed protein product [Adineta steineri]CAF3743970.1 unnamed protein product [Adineta steineri]
MGPKLSKQNFKSSYGATTCYTRQPQQCMAQNYLLVWLDDSIDDSNNDYQDTLAQLKNVINNVNLCTLPDQCIQILKQFDDERAVVITSDSLSQHLIPKIHDMPHLDAIYIFCDDKFRHQGWTQNWTKIKGVHTNITEICQALQLAVKQYDQDTIAVSFLTLNEMASLDNLNQLESNFMYTKILKAILPDIEYDRKAIKNLAACCREVFDGNPTQLQIIDEFERDYHLQQALWWYTRECFTFKMLNQALQILDANIIINMGFFLRDVHQQIQQLYEQQVSSYDGKSFKVYRGQGLMKSDFEKLQKAEGGIMSFNNFLSTSTNEKVSLSFARDASTKLDIVGILFIMSIDPCIKSTPFASIKNESYFKEEDEVLFSMHTVFRVSAIKQMGYDHKLYQVELQIMSDDEQQLRLLTDQIREEATGDNGWRRLCKLLLKIGQFIKAEELCDALLENESDDTEKAYYYVCLGYVQDHKGDYAKAIWYYEKALEIEQNTLPSNHPSLTISYNNIGSLYDKIRKYSKALSSHEKALEIYQKTLPSNHPSLATSYGNIGLVYNNMEEYSKALSFHEKALEIRQRIFPLNHCDLATSYGNIGLVYNNMGEYSKALSFHEKALEIFHETLPSNHPSLATSYNNISLVYDNMGEYSKAISFCEKALKIFQETFPSNHRDLAISYNNIGLMYDNMGEYSKAISFCEKALKIFQETLPSNHPLLATSYNNIGSVYEKIREYSKALLSHEKALGIRQSTLPSNHSLLATSYGNIGLVHDNMGEYSKAISSHEKALEIQHKTLPSDHPDLATSYSSIGSVYDNMGEYSKALSFHEKALDIRQNTLPSNHTSLANSYSNIGSVYYKTGEYSEAFLSHKKALEIREKTLPSSHPDLGPSYNNIGLVYYNMNNYRKALSYFERALYIFQHALPPTHPYIKEVKESIEIVKKKL